MRSRPARAAATAAATVVVVCATLAATVPALAGTAQAAVTTPPWLQRLNDVRLAAGVPAVTENAAWTVGIQHHLTYLELTDPSLRTGQYASAHTENPASPYYTADGALEGSRSNLVKNASQTSTSAVDYWLGAPFHAIGMLRAGLYQAAFAQDGTYAGMDIISGLSSGTRATTPILFPGPGSTSYLTTYAGHESPDPIETCRSAKPGADYSAPGLPIIAMLTAAPASNLTATLTTPGGTVLSSKDADLCVVDQNTYVSSDSVYGSSGLQILTNDHAVLVVPRTRLVAGSYAVRISQAKQPDVAWSFEVDPNAAPTASPTSTTPTTSAPTTSAPTTTAPTTTAPTTTAPTSTAPTSAATTAATTPSATPTATTTTAAPVALDPSVTVVGTTCSFGARASGSADIAVTNPADGAGAATYSVVVGTHSVTATAPEGGSGRAAVTGLPAGPGSGSVAGSDGSSAVFSVDVPTCPRYQGVRVRLHELVRHRLRIVLDNTRNAASTRFRVEIGTAKAPHLVAAADTAALRVRLHRSTRIRVYVGDHLVARAQVGA